ncbi:MAG: UbiA family prenyltransferase [Bacteroidota bacterium]
MKKSTLLHLRIPFSIFLLHVFLFAVAVLGAPADWKLVLVFLTLHLLIYPASNGYNSYFDKDEGSIGGLKRPPAVSKELYWVALLFDFAGTVLAMLVSWRFAIMILIYGLISKAYSHPAVRLKKYPILGWVAAGVFQGYFTFMMVVVALSGMSFAQLADWNLQYPALLSTALLFGSYPMTQVYQHEEDSRRGDRTISILLGIEGTFLFTALFFTLSVAGFLHYFIEYSTLDWQGAVVFQLFLIPVLVFFLRWFTQVRRDPTKADFQRTMRLNWLSSTALNLFFLGWWLLA